LETDRRWKSSERGWWSLWPGKGEKVVGSMSWNGGCWECESARRGEESVFWGEGGQMKRS
jgi:hypothetical protein